MVPRIRAGFFRKKTSAWATSALMATTPAFLATGPTGLP